jgi:2-polyprenyl-3-methyl-5-hydroxy-6-metoxy-1,4-benzoquinol methylase
MKQMIMSKELDVHVPAYAGDFEYAFDNDVMLNWYPKRLIALTSDKNKVLELGVGHGYTCNHFSNYYEDYSVVDGSEAIIEEFRHHYPDSKSRLIHSYFETFASKQVYDVIIMGFILEHVDDPLVVLNHFKQFLAPNGRIFVCVPNAESLHRRFGHKAGLLPDMFTLSLADKALGHQRLYTVASLTRQLEECGYLVSHKEGIFLKPFTTRQLISLDLSAEILDGMCEVGIDYPELSAGFLFEATPVA